jgi:hypothetical protein
LMPLDVLKERERESESESERGGERARRSRGASRRKKPPVLEEFYSSDRGREALSQLEIVTMVGNWVGIQEDPDIQESEIEEVIISLIIKTFILFFCCNRTLNELD